VDGAKRWPNGVELHIQWRCGSFRKDVGPCGDGHWSALPELRCLQLASMPLALVRMKRAGQEHIASALLHPRQGIPMDRACANGV
jgi:hypothetical protein